METPAFAARKAPARRMSFTPDDLEFVFLSFEGPDQPYAQAGGLGVRVTHLTRALARHGFQTHLVFVGDPALPGGETREKRLPPPPSLVPMDQRLAPGRRLRRRDRQGP